MTNISILTMMLDWPDDTFVEQLPAPAFTAAIIFFFVLPDGPWCGLRKNKRIPNDGGQFPSIIPPLIPLYRTSLKYPFSAPTGSIFCLFLASIILGSILSTLITLWGHDALAINAQNAHNHCTKTQRKTVERAHTQHAQQHRRIRLSCRHSSERKETGEDPCWVLVNPLPHVRHCAPKYARLARLCLSGLLGSVRFFVLGFLRFYVDFRLCTCANHVFLILHRK